MPEPFDSQLSRVRQMADGDPQWDLSPNDQAALRAVLDELDRLNGIIDRMCASHKPPRKGGK